LFLQISVMQKTQSPVKGIHFIQKYLKMPDCPKKKKRRKESNISKCDYVLSSEVYQNQHKATAAQLSGKRKRKTFKDAQRPKAERPKGRGLAKSAQIYCSTKSETRSSAEKEKGRRSKTPT
jgi:hypothetical protein